MIKIITKLFSKKKLYNKHIHFVQLLSALYNSISSMLKLEVHAYTCAGVSKFFIIGGTS
jgi:hypothetical protein